jgi:predicted HicB family RNase H-like nuclease
MAQAQKGGATPKMKTIMMALPEELHTALKMKAAETKMTLKGFVIEAIRQAVEKGVSIELTAAGRCHKLLLF